VNGLVPIALYGWIAVVLALFSALPARRAVAASFIGAWLFLPQAAIPFQGLPDLDKVTATSFGALVGVLIFDAARLLSYRPHWVDVPMIVWCVTPFGSSIANGLGVWDGLSTVLGQVTTWGIPYFLGRLYFSDLQALRELAIAVLIGGLIYVPLCLIEIRLSPQLHRWVYGYHAHSFAQTIRWGGYRPTVFMQHGLMVAMWMISATLMAFWLWGSGALRRLWSVPTSLISVGLLVTCVLCKSAGALMLLVAGLGVAFAARFVRIPALVLVLVAVPPTYVYVRTAGLWDGHQVVELAQRVNRERARSIEGRFENEAMISAKALKQPLFGWGTWGRWRVRDDYGNDITTSDSLWVISLGQFGCVGLGALGAVLLLPAVLLLRRIPFRQWMHPAAGGAAALAIALVLYTYDGLLNAMLNPVFVLAAGGLSGFYVMAPELASRLRDALAEQRRRAVVRPVAAEPGLARSSSGVEMG
jgi:hypothetical protein